MRKYFSDHCLQCYLDLVSVTADLLLLLLLRLLADLTVQLVGQLSVVLGLVNEGIWRLQISITFNQSPHMSSYYQKAPIGPYCAFTALWLMA